MREIRVICPDCGDVVEHHCHSNIQKAIVDLLTWVPSHGPATEGLTKALVKAGRECEWIGKDDKTPPEERFDAPIFGSQAWSYLLLGSKDESRTFHALIHNVCRAAGVDPTQVMSDFYQERDARRKAEADRKAGVQKRKDERAGVIAFLKSKKVSLDQRIAKLDELLTKQATLRKLIPFGAATEDRNYQPYLSEWLDTWYGGGINSEINRARITKLEHEAYDLAQEQSR